MLKTPRTCQPTTDLLAAHIHEIFGTAAEPPEGENTLGGKIYPKAGL